MRRGCRCMCAAARAHHAAHGIVTFCIWFVHGQTGVVFSTPSSLQGSWWGQHSPMDVTAQSEHPCRIEARGCACGVGVPRFGGSVWHSTGVVNKRTKKHNGHGGSASCGGFWWTSGKGRERRGSQTADCRTVCSLDCDTCSVANNRTTASIIAQPPDSCTPSGIRTAERRAAAGARRR